MSAAELASERVQLLDVGPADVVPLRRMRATPSVHRWWGPPENDEWPLDDPTLQTRAVWSAGALVGFVQWYEEPDERYRSASVDLFLAPEAQGRGLGREVVNLVVRHLLARGHHRVVIDPAADNQRAIACYTSCGFRPVGVLRRYERDADGQGWHDGLLMELVVQ